MEEQIEVFDAANTSSAQDTRHVVLPTNGVYFVWTLSGHKLIRFTKPDATTTNAAGLSGIFFGK